MYHIMLISNPASIINYYTSGMSWNDWIDSQVQMGNASILLGGVTVTAYDQASYDRAAREIWHQICYGADYSGGSGYSNAVSQSYGRGSAGGISPLAPGAGLAVSGIGAGAEWGKTAKPAKYGTRFASASKLTKVGAKAANMLSKGATAVGGLVTLNGTQELLTHIQLLM